MGTGVAEPVIGAFIPRDGYQLNQSKVNYNQNQDILVDKNLALPRDGIDIATDAYGWVELLFLG